MRLEARKEYERNWMYKEAGSLVFLEANYTEETAFSSLVVFDENRLSKDLNVKNHLTSL